MSKRKVASYLWAVLLLAVIAPMHLWADQITVESDASTLGARWGGDESVFSSYNANLISQLPFTPVNPFYAGAAQSVSTPPDGAMAISIAPDCGTGCLNQGFFETAFTLPAGFADVSLFGEGGVDEMGWVFLNGNLISGELDGRNVTYFSTTNAGFFQAGSNTLVISEDTVDRGPKGAQFFVTIDYTDPAPTPEPGTMLLLGSGLAGLAGSVRRKRGHHN